jgi:hypothetical protein
MLDDGSVNMDWPGKELDIVAVTLRITVLRVLISEFLQRWMGRPGKHGPQSYQP